MLRWWGAQRQAKKTLLTAKGQGSGAGGSNHLGLIAQLGQDDLDTTGALQLPTELLEMRPDLRPEILRNFAAMGP